jgi:hypothetical protein
MKKQLGEENMNLVYYGEKYYTESQGYMGTMYDELTGLSVCDDDMKQALVSGEEVHIRPATVHDTYKMDMELAICKAQLQAKATELDTLITKAVTNILGGDSAD